MDSRRICETRLHKVLAHIDAHLAEPLELYELAAVAHFSPFHFHRLFAAWMGQTLGDHVRQRRLERAASRLISLPGQGVLDVALGVGFNSGEAFARAFKLHFGCSPSAWRQGWQRSKRNPDQVSAAVSRQDAAPCPTLNPESAPPSLRVVMRQSPALPVAYLRRHGSYGPELTGFWVETVTPWLVRNGLTGRSLYGIGHDDPDVVPHARCRYDACVQIAPGEAVQDADGLRAFTGSLAAGPYAVAEMVGDNAAINQAWRWLLRSWLPGSGLQLDDRSCFEHYPPASRYNPDTGQIACELFAPVMPL